MSLDSTETLTKAIGGKFNNGSETASDPEVEVCTGDKQPVSWCYLFVHHAKTDQISKKIKEEFCTFIHTSILYKHDKKHIKKEKRPTVSGLIFIQGRSDAIQSFLNKNFQGLYLVKDCTTQKTAVIKDSVMRPFMQIAQIAPTRIRFMPHTFGYYSAGNPLIRITSGVLSGFEGYRIRIARDKCFVTSIGGMTIAIGGIHKESFENMDEYIRQRRIKLSRSRQSFDVQLTPLQTEIDKGFFVPQNQVDVMAIAHSASFWIDKMKLALKEKDFDGVAEISLFLLEEIGCHFTSAYYHSSFRGIDNIITICQEVDRILNSLLNSTDVPIDLKETVVTEREALAVRFPFLPVKN